MFPVMVSTNPYSLPAPKAHPWLEGPLFALRYYITVMMSLYFGHVVFRGKELPGSRVRRQGRHGREASPGSGVLLFAPGVASRGFSRPGGFAAPRCRARAAAGSGTARELSELRVSESESIRDAVRSRSSEKLHDALARWLTGTFTDAELVERQRVETGDSKPLQDRLSVVTPNR